MTRHGSARRPTPYGPASSQWFGKGFGHTGPLRTSAPGRWSRSGGPVFEQGLAGSERRRELKRRLHRYEDCASHLCFSLAPLFRCSCAGRYARRCENPCQTCAPRRAVGGAMKSKDGSAVFISVQPSFQFSVALGAARPCSKTGRHFGTHRPGADVRMDPLWPKPCRTTGCSAGP